MKRIITLFALFLIVGTVFGQQQDEIQSLIKRDQEIRGFGAPEFRFSEILDSWAFFAGASGGMIINKHFIVGVGGYALANELQFQGVDPVKNLYLDGGYGGIQLGGIIAPKEIVHVAIPIFLGAGSWHVTDKTFETNNFVQEVTLESSSFVVVEPSVQVEVNLSRYVRLALGGSYRFIQGTSLENLSDSDLSNWAGNIAVRIGNF